MSSFGWRDVLAILWTTLVAMVKDMVVPTVLLILAFFVMKWWGML